MTRIRAGIFLGRERAAGVLVRPSRRETRVLAHAECDLPEAAWTRPDPDFAEVFRTLARGLGPMARRADTETSVALPDPLIFEETLSFRDAPDSAAETAALVRWRLARDYRRPEEEIACTFRPLGTRDGQHVFLARMMPRRLRDAVLDAGRRAGLRITRFEGLSRFLAARTAGREDPSATIFANDDFWTVVFDGGAGEDVQAQSDWIADAPDGDPAARIARFVKSVAMTAGIDGYAVAVRAPDALYGPIFERLGRAPDGGPPAELPDPADATSIAKCAALA